MYINFLRDQLRYAQILQLRPKSENKFYDVFPIAIQMACNIQGLLADESGTIHVKLIECGLLDVLTEGTKIISELTCRDFKDDILTNLLSIIEIISEHPFTGMFVLGVPELLKAVFGLVL